MSQTVQTAPTRLPVILNIASFLKDNKILKQRTGLLNNTQDVEFFRYKRVIRALLSDEYKKKQANPKNELLPITSAEDATKVFVQLIQSQLVVPADKLHYQEIKDNRWKPNRLKPTLKPTNKARLEPDSYFVWNYDKPNPFIVLYGLLVIAGVFAVILFPLWPNFMRVGVWYLSMGLLGLLGLFFLIAIVRLIIYVVTLVALPRAFWLYPNLFEDCGVLESFVPLYAWEEPKKGKKKRSEGKDVAVSSSATASGASTGSGSAKRRVTLEEVE